jgi:mannose-6-phosphate isomerase-like protein (cupin superfamily)
MGLTRIAFPSLPWQPGAHPLEKKKTAAARPVTLLEFAPGFADPNWCERAHVFLILAGTLELELRDGPARLATGECGIVDAGTPHRARNPGDVPCVLFAVSDVVAPPS